MVLCLLPEYVRIYLNLLSTREMLCVPLAATQPQSMINLTACLTVEQVFFSWNSMPFVLQTYLIFMHLADAFIFTVLFKLYTGFELMTFCAANTMVYCGVKQEHIQYPYSLWPKSSILTSSVRRTFIQNASCIQTLIIVVRMQKRFYSDDFSIKAIFVQVSLNSWTVHHNSRVWPNRGFDLLF